HRGPATGHQLQRQGLHRGPEEAQRLCHSHGRTGIYRETGASAVGVVPAGTQGAVRQLEAGSWKPGTLPQERQTTTGVASACYFELEAGRRGLMSYVIDRRLNGKNKSTVNRQRFLRRYKAHIKKAVEEAVGRRSITDIEHGEQISIPGRDIDEPIFHHGPGGRQTRVFPGNREFATGDRIARPEGGGGGGGGNKAGNSGEGEDDFVFQITQEEF